MKPTHGALGSRHSRDGCSGRLYCRHRHRPVVPVVPEVPVVSVVQPLVEKVLGRCGAYPFVFEDVVNLGIKKNDAKKQQWPLSSRTPLLPWDLLPRLFYTRSGGAGEGRRCLSARKLPFSYARNRVPTSRLRQYRNSSAKNRTNIRNGFRGKKWQKRSLPPPTPRAHPRPRWNPKNLPKSRSRRP